MISLGTGLNPPFPRSVMAQIIQKALLQYGSTLITNSDGTRAIKNEGTAPDSDAALFSGQGLKPTGDQGLDTGLTVNLSEDKTIMWTQELALDPDYYVFGARTGNSGLAFGQPDDNTNMFIKVHTNNYEYPHGKSTGDFITCAVTFNSSANTFDVYFDGSLVAGNVSYTTPTGLTDYFNVLGFMKDGSLSLANGMRSVMKDVFCIPSELSDSQIQAHYQNPERTFYWEGDVAKSAILDQAIIDSMVAGNGFVYLLNEDVNTSDSKRTRFVALDLTKSRGVTNADVTGYSISLTNAANSYTVDGHHIEFTLADFETTSRPSIQINGVDSNKLYEVKMLFNADEDFPVRTFRGEDSNYNYYQNAKGGHLLKVFCKPMADGRFIVTFNGENDGGSGIHPVVPNFITVDVEVTEVAGIEVTGMTDSTPRTNADQLAYGAQNAIYADDLRSLRTINVEANTFIDAQTQFDSVGLSLTDNAGQYEVRNNV